MAETGYGCEFGDCTAQPVHLHTDTRTGNTVSLCADHNGPGLIPLVAAELGVDPMAFYTNVEKFIANQAKKAERELANAQAAKVAESSDDPATSPDDGLVDEDDVDREPGGLLGVPDNTHQVP